MSNKGRFFILKNRKNKNIILWVISIFLILSILVCIKQVTPQAILMGILGLLVMPPINKKINEKIINGNKTKNTIKIISEIILFIVILFNIPTNENTSSTNNINNQNINNAISTILQIVQHQKLQQVNRKQHLRLK